MKPCDIPSPAQPTFAKATAGRLENRGMLWVIGAFVFCPCHLPITLGVLALFLGGTAAGALLGAHPVHRRDSRDCSLGGGHVAGLSAGALRPTPQTHLTPGTAH